MTTSEVKKCQNCPATWDLAKRDKLRILREDKSPAADVVLKVPCAKTDVILE